MNVQSRPRKTKHAHRHWIVAEFNQLDLDAFHRKGTSNLIQYLGAGKFLRRRFETDVYGRADLNPESAADPYQLTRAHDPANRGKRSKSDDLVPCDFREFRNPHCQIADQ